MRNGSRPAMFLTQPPEERGERWDEWCWAMVRRRGYAPAFVAERVGASAEAVRSAVRRVECGRYGDPAEIV